MKKQLCWVHNDTYFEVLSRFWARDLHRLKFVCKEWQSLISDRSFVCFQMKKKIEPLSGFFFQEKYQWADEDIPRISYVSLQTTKVHSKVFNFLPESVVLLASCNGLICCRSSFPSTEPVLYVCNPLNKEWVSLKWVHPSKKTSVALAFDPSQLPKGNASPKFKVVTLSQTTTTTTTAGDFEYLFGIYSSETGKWKQSEEKCRCKHELFKNKGIFVGGTLYWLTDGDQILMFDPEVEFSWLISVPLPTTVLNSISEMCIGESNGKLHCVLLSEQGLQLWVLEDYLTSSWDLTFSISLKNLEDENSNFLFGLDDMFSSRRIIDIWTCLLTFKDGILFVRVATDIYSYQFETRKMEKLCNLSQLGQNSLYFPIVLPYSMSLAPLSAA